MKETLLLFVVLLLNYNIKAQQDPMFTHYAYNTQAINPAYAGTRDALTITGLYRSQWVSFEGAPITQTITAHTPIYNYKIGLGVSLLNDKIGPSKTTSLYLDFSYKIKINEKAKLSFGLKSGFNYQKVNLNEVDVKDKTDPLFLDDVTSDFLPNFGFGIYYYTDRYYFGVSIPKLLENDFTENSVSGSIDLASEKKHYFLIGGAAFSLTEDIILKPTTFIKITGAAPIEVDLTANFIYMNRFWLGAMYRTGDSFGALVGMNIIENLAIGYSFDWSVTNTTFQYNQGSHEIMICYDFIFKEKKIIRSPRYF